MIQSETIVDDAFKAWHRFVCDWERQLTVAQYNELLKRVKAACEDELAVDNPPE